MMNDFFSSVFTREDLDQVPLSKSLTQEKLANFEVTADVICCKLCNLKIDKAAGDAGMAPCILKDLSEEIAIKYH